MCWYHCRDTLSDTHTVHSTRTQSTVIPTHVGHAHSTQHTHTVDHSRLQSTTVCPNTCGTTCGTRCGTTCVVPTHVSRQWYRGWYRGQVGTVRRCSGQRATRNAFKKRFQETLFDVDATRSSEGAGLTGSAGSRSAPGCRRCTAHARPAGAHALGVHFTVRRPKLSIRRPIPTVLLLVKRGIVQTTAVCSDTCLSIENRSANAQFWPANCKVHSLLSGIAGTCVGSNVDCVRATPPDAHAFLCGVARTCLCGGSTVDRALQPWRGRVRGRGRGGEGACRVSQRTGVGGVWMKEETHRPPRHVEQHDQLLRPPWLQHRKAFLESVFQLQWARFPQRGCPLLTHPG